MGPRSRATLTVIVSLFLSLSCGGWTSVEALTPTITLYTVRRQVPNLTPTARTIYPDGYFFLPPTVGPPRGIPQVIIGDNEVRAARDLTSPIIGALRLYRSPGFATTSSDRTYAFGLIDFFNEDTISISGVINASVPVGAFNELAVVGGTGKYRNANGYYQVATLPESNSATGVIVFQVNIYIS
ncbi:hypothetical protein R1flu_017076 [Riccia fluitans]|uniref:Dirigent protein n=1 Tax=Riccia fluitans TaxID=41844 RepID=A0ABD1YNQ7_9MARC